MASGFKGTEAKIAECLVKGTSTGTTVRYRVLFADAEGFVHAHTTHELEIGEDSPLHAPAKALLDALRQHTEQVHFETSTTATPKDFRGIVERASEPSDDPGESG